MSLSEQRHSLRPCRVKCGPKLPGRCRLALDHVAKQEPVEEMGQSTRDDALCPNRQPRDQLLMCWTITYIAPGNEGCGTAAGATTAGLGCVDIKVLCVQ